MLYGYDIVEVERKINKKKVFLVILILCIIITISVVGAIYFVQYNKQKEIEEEGKRQEEEQLAQIEEQKRLQEEERIKLEKEEAERKRKEEIINSTELTEEQLQAVENIYSDVGEKRVFLTFDDGPYQAVTPLILDLLKEENIKATFFVLGNRAKINPELIQREYNEGHYVANHGYTHKYSEIYKSIENVFNEYDYTENAIQEALGNPNYHSKLFRFPGGSVGGYYHTFKSNAKQELRNYGIASVDWNCLSRDAEGVTTVEELMENVLLTMGEKQSVVILMHDTSDKITTYEVLPEVIKYLRENGYAFKNFYDIL